MKKTLRVVYFLLFFLVSFIALFNTFKFYSWYKKKPLDIIIDIDYFIENNFDLHQLYSFLSALKIDKVAFDIKYINKIPKDFKFNLKFFNESHYDKEQIIASLQTKEDEIFSIVYLINDIRKPSCGIKYPHYLILKELNFFAKLNFENYHYYKVYRTVDNYKLPLRTFVCDLNLYREQRVINLKVKKAIYERSCSIVYIIPSEYVSVQENLKVISNLSRYIDSRFKLSKNFLGFKSINLKRFGNLLVFVFAVILPLFLYKKELNKILKTPILLTYIKINFLAILVGVVIWGILENYKYVSLEEHIYGIKLMFILPLIFSFFVILDKKELLKLLNYNLKLKNLLFFCFCFFIIYYLLLRMGNVSSEYILNAEIKIREFIENYILFRPRFKEILFTQPALYISIFLIKKGGYSLMKKVMFCFSILTFSSIINTFLHVHTPLHICILRSIVSTVVGLIFSYFYILNFRLLKIRIFS